jgi:hypothetical protein
MLVRLPVFLFILTGIKLNQFVDNAIQDSQEVTCTIYFQKCVNHLWIVKAIIR